MSRIAIVIGLPDNKADSPPSLVYLGRSGEEMRQAMLRSTSPRLIVIPHATGIPKHNPHAAANAAALKSGKAPKESVAKAPPASSRK